jgi:hypothetical protein
MLPVLILISILQAETLKVLLVMFHKSDNSGGTELINHLNQVLPTRPTCVDFLCKIHEAGFEGKIF